MTYFGPQELTIRIPKMTVSKTNKNHSCYVLSVDQIASITIKREPGY